MNTARVTGTKVTPAASGGTGIAVLAGVLVASPLLQWLTLSGLSHFTFLEPPFTTSRGLVLAMQLFFAPGSVIGLILGVGLMRRSERMRKFARVLFMIAFGFAVLQLGMQAWSGQSDANTPLAVTSIALSALYWWYFGRPSVRQQFRVSASGEQVQAAAMRGSHAVPAPVEHSRALVIGACVECFLGLAAVLLVAHLYTIFYAGPLLDMGGGDSVAAADDLLKAFLFVSLALLLSPHVLTTAACIGILLGRDAAGMARRQVLVACWAAVGCLLLTAWLITRPEFAFDARTSQWLIGLCGVSLAWHACFLYLLARVSPAGMR